MSNDEGSAIIRKFQRILRYVAVRAGPQDWRSALISSRREMIGDAKLRRKLLSSGPQASFFDSLIESHKKVMAFVPSPKPSDDPLLQRAAIDFNSHMVLSIISHDPNRLIDSEI